MEPSQLKSIGEFLLQLEHLMNRHQCTFVFETHDRIMHPKFVVNNAKIKVTYSENLGIEFNVIE